MRFNSFSEMYDALEKELEKELPSNAATSDEYEIWLNEQYNQQLNLTLKYDSNNGNQLEIYIAQSNDTSLYCDFINEFNAYTIQERELAS